MNSLEALHQHVGHLLSTKQLRATLTGALALTFFAACSSPANISKEAVEQAGPAMSEVLTIRTQKGQHVLRTLPAELNQKDVEGFDGLVSLTESEVIFVGAEGQANILLDNISALESTENSEITKIFISTYKTPPYVLSFAKEHAGLAKRFMDDLSNLVMLSRQGAVDPTPAALASWNQSKRLVSADSASAGLDLADQLETVVARIKVDVERQSDPLHGYGSSKTALLTNTRLRIFDQNGTYQVMLADLGSLTYDRRLGFMYAIADGDYPIVLKTSTNSDNQRELKNFFQKLQELTILNRTSQAVITPDIATSLTTVAALPIARTNSDLRALTEERRYSVSAKMDRKGDGDTFYGKRDGQLTFTTRRLVFTVADDQKEVIYQIPLTDITKQSFTNAGELGGDDKIELENGGDYPIHIFLPSTNRKQNRQIFQDVQTMKQELADIWKVPAAPTRQPSKLPRPTAMPGPDTSAPTGRLDAHLAELASRQGVPVPKPTESGDSTRADSIKPAPKTNR